MLKSIAEHVRKVLDLLSHRWNKLRPIEKAFGYLLSAFSVVYTFLFLFNIIFVCPSLRRDIADMSNATDILISNAKYMNICRDPFDLIPIFIGALILILIIYARKHKDTEN